MASSRIPPQEPPNFPETPETLLQRAKQLVTRYNQGLKEIVAQVEPGTATSHNLILPIAHLVNEFNSESWSLTFYQYVFPDAALREAARKASQIIHTKKRNIPDISEHAKTIHAKEVDELDLESWLFLRSQMDRSSKGPNHHQIKEINNKLAQIIIDFEAKLGDDCGGMWLSKAELDRVPRSVIDGLTKNAGQDERFFVKYNSPASEDIMQYAKDSNTRKKVYIEEHNMHINKSKLFKEAILLLHKRATLLEYPNQATYGMEGNMIEHPDAARSLLTKFRERVTRVGVLESAIEEKRKDPQAEDKTFYFWDESYYTRIWKETTSLIDQTKIAEYFPLQPTVCGMFSIFQELFGIVFEKVNGNFWDKDVQLYAVWDDKESGGAFSGYLFLDLHERPGKYQGACNFGLQPGFLSRNGDRSYAVNALVCNFPPPTPTKPCLLKHHQLRTLFHEFGHSMHAILSRATYSQYSGTLNAYDFLETPGLLLENWCWVPDQLKKLSGHFESGESIPDDVVNNIIRARDAEERMLDLFQVALAAFDLAVYTPASQKDAEEMNLTKLWHDINSEIRGLKGTENSDWDHGYAARKHSISNYPGSLTIYISNFCIAGLIWESLFAKDPMSREAGMRWRREVLEKGGTQKPMDMLENLLGKRLKVSDLVKL